MIGYSTLFEIGILDARLVEPTLLQDQSRSPMITLFGMIFWHDPLDFRGICGAGSR
jgi:hypothetical protein